MSKIAAVLSANYREALWTLNGDDYAGLIWRSPNIAQPTEAEIDAQWPAVQQAQAQVETDSLRQAAYAAESDPLFFKWQRGEATQQDWLDKIAEIQARYPDPEV